MGGFGYRMASLTIHPTRNPRSVVLGSLPKISLWGEMDFTHYSKWHDPQKRWQIIGLFANDLLKIEGYVTTTVTPTKSFSMIL